MDSVQFGDVLTEIELKDGYFITHSEFTIFSIVSFWRDNEKLQISFINRYGIWDRGLEYSNYIGGPSKTREWFMDQLMEHPPVFEWFLFNPEIFQSKT